MKKLLVLALPICFALNLKAQDVDSHYMDQEYRMPEKINRWDFMPPLGDGFDMEADKALLETPYTSQLNSSRPVKIEKGMQYRDDKVPGKEQKPMLPWQKEHPLLWSKPQVN